MYTADLTSRSHSLKIMSFKCLTKYSHIASLLHKVAVIKRMTMRRWTSIYHAPSIRASWESGFDRFDDEAVIVACMLTLPTTWESCCPWSRSPYRDLVYLDAAYITWKLLLSREHTAPPRRQGAMRLKLTYRMTTDSQASEPRGGGGLGPSHFFQIGGLAPSRLQ